MELPGYRQIEARRAEWVSLVNASDLSKYVELVSEDVVWLPPGQHPIEGREAFREWLKPFFERFDYEFALNDVDIGIWDDWAIETGAFETLLTGQDGTTAKHSGRYLVFWHRHSDDRWYLDRYVDRTKPLGHDTD